MAVDRLHENQEVLIESILRDARNDSKGSKQVKAGQEWEEEEMSKGDDSDEDMDVD